MRAEERRSKIIGLLEQQSSVLVDDLTKLFAISAVSIRKDLAELEERGVLHRTHGGATYAHKSLFNPSFGEKINLQQAQKEAIAHAALEFIEDGDSIILGAGSTVLMLARLMKKRFRSLYIITNSIPVALELADTTWEILLVGGQIRQHSMALIGPAAVRTLEVYHADKVFFGATGVSLTKGYSTPHADMSNIVKAMINAADTAYALVDSSKLGRATLVSFAALRDAALLITDTNANPDFLEAMRQQQLQVQIAASSSSF
jgi:DeoR family transcriptional regulator, fructose operon transcriptional repressor